MEDVQPVVEAALVGHEAGVLELRLLRLRHAAHHPDGRDHPRHFLPVQLQQAVQLPVKPLHVAAIQRNGNLSVPQGRCKQPHFVEALRRVGVEHRTFLPLFAVSQQSQSDLVDQHGLFIFFLPEFLVGLLFDGLGEFRSGEGVQGLNAFGPGKHEL